jgi:hypothetical protein
MEQHPVLLFDCVAQVLGIEWRKGNPFVLGSIPGMTKDFLMIENSNRFFESLCSSTMLDSFFILALDELRLSCH